jgi:hypothetical protein
MSADGDQQGDGKPARGPVPGAALVAPQTLIEPAERRLDEIVAALRRLRVRVADLEAP